VSALPLRGVFAPVVTPFTADGSLDRDGWLANARAMLAAGLDGLVIAGSTGEAPLLDETDRHRLVEWTRKLVTSDKRLIVGCGAESTRLTSRRCNEAAARGADAVLVVAPHYYGSAMSPEALRAHYHVVCDESPIPVVLYNIPKYMHFALPAELVAELAQHENVIGIKDSSGDAAIRAGYQASQSDSFSVITGHAGSFVRALDEGARGGILAVATFAPELVRQVMVAHSTGDREALGPLQEQLAMLGARIVAGMGVAGVKAAVDAVGLSGGTPRLPLLAVSQEVRQEVASLLGGAGVPPLGSVPALA